MKRVQLLFLLSVFSLLQTCFTYQLLSQFSKDLRSSIRSQNKACSLTLQMHKTSQSAQYSDTEFLESVCESKCTSRRSFVRVLALNVLTAVGFSGEGTARTLLRWNACSCLTLTLICCHLAASYAKDSKKRSADLDVPEEDPFTAKPESGVNPRTQRLYGCNTQKNCAFHHSLVAHVTHAQSWCHVSRQKISNTKQKCEQLSVLGAHYDMCCARMKHILSDAAQFLCTDCFHPSDTAEFENHHMLLKKGEMRMARTSSGLQGKALRLVPIEPCLLHVTTFITYMCLVCMCICLVCPDTLVCIYRRIWVFAYVCSFWHW